MTTDVFHTLRGRYPGWQCWRGVSGLLYARNPRTSPPVIVRAEDASLLEAAMLAVELDRDVSEKSGEVTQLPARNSRPKKPHELKDGGHSDWYDRP